MRKAAQTGSPDKKALRQIIFLYKGTSLGHLLQPQKMDPNSWWHNPHISGSPALQLFESIHLAFCLLEPQEPQHDPHPDTIMCPDLSWMPQIVWPKHPEITET